LLFVPSDARSDEILALICSTGNIPMTGKNFGLVVLYDQDGSMKWSGSTVELTAWSIWKQGNCCVFSGDPPNVQQLVSTIEEEAHGWAGAGTWACPSYRHWLINVVLHFVILKGMGNFVKLLYDLCNDEELFCLFSRKIILFWRLLTFRTTSK
jgi:hypothetical protein